MFRKVLFIHFQKVTSSDYYTIVLDLDETMVHYRDDLPEPDFEKRPGLLEFLVGLRDVGQKTFEFYAFVFSFVSLSGCLLEVVVFTASTEDYGSWVLDKLLKEYHDKGGETYGRIELQLLYGNLQSYFSSHSPSFVSSALCPLGADFSKRLIASGSEARKNDNS